MIQSYVNYGWRDYVTLPVLPYPRRAWEFQAIVSGSCWLISGDKAQEELRAPSLAVFGPAFVHGWLGNPSQTCEIVVFHYTAVPDRFLQAIANPAQYKGKASIGSTEAKRLRAYATETKHRLRLGQSIELLSLETLYYLTRLVLPGETDTGNAPTDRGPEAVAYAAALMDQHLQEGFGVEDAAREIGISSQYLRRLFLKHRGKTPQHVLTELRLQRACELLRLGNTTLEAIAPACGYSCAASLSRAFSTRFGQSPRVWRRQA